MSLELCILCWSVLCIPVQHVWEALLGGGRHVCTMKAPRLRSASWQGERSQWSWCVYSILQSYSLRLRMAVRKKWLQMATVSKKVRGLLGLEVRIVEELHAGHCGWPMQNQYPVSGASWCGFFMIGKHFWLASESASVSRCCLHSSNDEFDSTKLQVAGECTSSHTTWDGQWFTSWCEKVE